MSREENVRKNHNIETGKKSFACVAKFRLLGKNVTNKNCMHVGIENRKNSGNACCCAVQNILSSRVLSKNTNIKRIQKYRLANCFIWCKTWSVTLRGYPTLGLWGKYFGLRGSRGLEERKILHKEELHDL